MDVWSDVESYNTNSHLDSDTIKIDINNTSIENMNVDIEEEKYLIEYTDNHFVNQYNTDMENIRQVSNTNTNFIESFESFDFNQIRSNSPITISNNNSDYENGSYHNHDHERESVGSGSGRSGSARGHSRKPRPSFKKLTYDQIESSLSRYYEKETKYSTELDIIITYLKGQKNLYIQAKHTCQNKLNALTIPCILITTAITIFAPFIQGYNWSGGFISGLNAIVTLLVSIINYFKLESAVEIFLYTANQFDKLETSLEIVNSKLMFIDNKNEQSTLIVSKIKEFEKKMGEIKSSSNILLPEEMKHLFPVICHINIFTFIKKIETYKKNLIINFRDVKNEIRYIQYNLDNCPPERDMTREKKRMVLLYDVKEKIKNELIEYKNAYGYLDDIFTREIKNAEKKRFFWFTSVPDYHTFQKRDSVIDKHLNFIFEDK